MDRGERILFTDKIGIEKRQLVRNYGLLFFYMGITYIVDNEKYFAETGKICNRLINVKK